MYTIKLKLNPKHLKDVPELHKLINYMSIDVPRVPVKGDLIDLCAFIWWKSKKEAVNQIINKYDIYEVEQVIFTPFCVDVILGYVEDL